MTSFETTNIINKNTFMPTFKIQGQIYHQIGSLMPITKTDEKFLQIYFIGDEGLELEKRCSIISHVEEDIIAKLQKMLHKQNRIIQLFKYAIEKLPVKNYNIIIKADKPPIGQHKGQFNSPTTNEVAIVMIDQEANSRDIIIQRRNDQLQRVSETHSWYDTLQYPLIFWDGANGYDFNLKRTNGKKVKK